MCGHDRLPPELLPKFTEPSCSEMALSEVLWCVGNRRFDDWLATLVGVLLSEFCSSNVMRAMLPIAVREAVVAFDLFPLIVLHILDCGAEVAAAILPAGLAAEIGILPSASVSAGIHGGIAEQLGRCFEWVFKEALSANPSAEEMAAARLLLMTLDYVRAVREKVAARARACANKQTSRQSN